MCGDVDATLLLLVVGIDGIGLGGGGAKGALLII